MKGVETEFGFADGQSSSAFRIAVPSFGLLRAAITPKIERQAISREEILDIFCDRLRPGNTTNPRYTKAEVQEADVSRRLRHALYPKG